jgi:poly(3-hydroxybutyrate) depolymerase
MTVDGTTRTFVVQVPANYNPNKAYPEIFVFHGAGGSHLSSIAMNLQGATGADQAIYLFPDGIDFTYGGSDFGLGWNQSCQGYDTDFTAAMMNYVETNLCVNTTTRFATGYSWGADMTDTLVCCMGNMFAAVAPSSGDEMDYNPYDPTIGFGSGLNCAASNRPAWRITYGSGDTNTQGGDGAYTLQQFKDSVGYMMNAQTCASTSTALDSNCVAYNNCAKAVIECNYPGLGHNLPSTWAQDTWNFFSRYLAK